MQNTTIINNASDVKSSAGLIDALQQMYEVLEKENSALLKGDAVLVGELAEEKLRLSNLLEENKPGGDVLAGEIRILGRQVKDLANSNHLLIEHMHQYYTGIMSMMIKMNNQTQTYGHNGYMNKPMAAHLPTRREIIA